MIDYFRSWVALKTDNRGVTALEYAIIAGVMGIGLVCIFTAFRGNVGEVFNHISKAM